MTRAVARRGDPQTSWLAAQSLGPELLRAQQRYVLAILQEHGPMIDEELVELTRDAGLSASGTRTRRSELAAFDIVYDTGARRLTAARRKSIVWAARYLVDERPTLGLGVQ